MSVAVALGLATAPSTMLACATTTVAATALTALVLRRLRRGSTREEILPTSLPFPLRVLLRMGRGLVPAVRPLLPAPLAARIDRRLQSLGLNEVDAARWTAAALCAGIGGGLLAAVLAGSAGFPVALPSVVGAALAIITVLGWPARRHRARDADILRTLPTYLDLLTICVEAGSTLTSGLRIAVDHAPEGPLQQYFSRVLREIRSGRGRVDAFRRSAEVFDSASLSALSTALIHSEASGMSLGEVLRAQARQRSAERFTCAERLAMQAPVRLLGPLVLFIFPCTFIVIALPIVARVLEVTR